MSSEQIYFGLEQYAILLFSLVFHEFGHAWTALRCGDPTAKYLGRVSLNPMVHADPIGTVLFPLLQIFTGVPLIGWAKPVPFNPLNLRHPGRDDMLISAAGPGFNMILAFTGALVWRLNVALLGGADAGFLHPLAGFLFQILPIFIRINVFLALFNLIPIPPLDGSWILYHLLPRDLAEHYREFGARWGFIVVLALLYTGVARAFIGFGYQLVQPLIGAVAGS